MQIARSIEELRRGGQLSYGARVDWMIWGCFILWIPLGVISTIILVLLSSANGSWLQQTVFYILPGFSVAAGFTPFTSLPGILYLLDHFEKKGLANRA